MATASTMAVATSAAHPAASRVDFRPESALISLGTAVPSSTVTDSPAAAKSHHRQQPQQPPMTGREAAVGQAQDVPNADGAPALAGLLDAALYDDLCARLNMDRPTRDRAWQTLSSLVSALVPIPYSSLADAAHLAADSNS